MNILFGTDGWRGIIGDDFTFENVRKVVRAIANFLYWPDRKNLDIYQGGLNKINPCPLRTPDKGIIVGYDTRFMSEKFAEAAAQEFAKCGVPVYLDTHPSPSSSISSSILDLETAGGIMITASHNHPYYNGIKFKAEYGGPGTPDIIWQIEKMLKNEPSYYPRSNAPAEIKKLDTDVNYIKKLRNLVDLDRIASARFKIVSDPIYGVSKGLLGKILTDVGIYVEEIRNENNPIFGGYNPEPIGKNMAPLVERVLRSKATIGFSFDGDGDRLGAVDSLGSFLQHHEIFATILWHLVENRKFTGGVATTFSTSKLIESMAKSYGVPLYETPVGFKHITSLMLDKDVLIGGEESGGIGIKHSIPEKDAMTVALLLLEAMAWSGLGIEKIIKKLTKQYGPHYFHRSDISIRNPQEEEAVLNELCKNTPSVFGDVPIDEIYTLDGIKYILKDKSWVLFRLSGTEPVLRIYAEATSHEQAGRMLADGEKIAREAIGKFRNMKGR